MAEHRERPSTGLFIRLLFCGCCDKDRVRIASIDLSHSLLTELPPEVYLCERTLEFLCLDSNHLVELPRQLFNCDELRNLSVSDNDIHFLPPAISFLQNLEHLDISKNAISTLPDTIRQCASLSYLDVSINPLEKLPEGLVNVISLQELYLTDTYLDFLPANFGKLVNLRILELRENSLSSLPKTMCRLINLTRLDIGFNEFTELPEVVCSLQNLTELWIDGNHIKKLNPSIGHLRKIVHFDASHNNLESLPRDIGYWTKVQEFNVSNNELVNLPNSIGNLINLVGLKLEENSLQSLPDSVGKLPCLQEIMATHNYLSHLPASIGLLRTLKILTVDKNYLVDIPPELGSCTSLSILSLRGNKISEIPAEIGHLSSLKVLNIVDNEIRHLPMSILKLEKLSALWLSNNQSQPLIPLQQDFDYDTNTTVLTCFMLPQQREPQPGPSTVPDEELRPVPRVAPRHIYFAPNTGIPLEQPGRLTRAPTPYPKELRALAKHAKHVQKTLSGSQPRSEDKVAHQVQGPPEIKEATVKIKPGTTATSSSAESTLRLVDLVTEPMVCPVMNVVPSETVPTPDSSVSSLPVAYESSPIIREAKNIRTDTQTGPMMHSPTPQTSHITPVTSKEAKVPPPYHIAAAYSVKAQFFNPSEYSAPENRSRSSSISADDNGEQNITTRCSSPIISSRSVDVQDVQKEYEGKTRSYLSDSTNTSPYLSESGQICVSPAVIEPDNEQENMNVSSESEKPTVSNKYSGKRASDLMTSVGECNDPDNGNSLGPSITQYSSSEGRGTASPTPDAGERAEHTEQPTMRSLSDYVVKPPVHEIDRYAISRPDDLEGEHISTLSLSGYVMKTPKRETLSAFDVNKYAIEDYQGATYCEMNRSKKRYRRKPSFSDSTSEQETSSEKLSPGEIRLPQESVTTLSPGEIRLPRQYSLEVCVPKSVPSSASLPESTHRQSLYSSERYSVEDVSDPQSGDSYSARRPHLHLDEFVSRSGNTTAVSSYVSSSVDGTPVDPSETSSRSDSSSRKNFTLSTPPLPQAQMFEYSLPSVAELSSKSDSGGSSDIIARSVECDINSSGNSNSLSDRSPTEYILQTPPEQILACSTHTLSPIKEQPEYLSPVASPLEESKNSSMLQSTRSAHVLPSSIAQTAESVQLSNAPLSTIQLEIISTESLSSHSSHSMSMSQTSRSIRPVQSYRQPLSTHSLQSEHSQQISSDQLMQSPHVSSSHIVQTPPLSSRHPTLLISSDHSIQSSVVSSAHSSQTARDSLVYSIRSLAVSPGHSMHDSLVQSPAISSGRSMHSMHDSLVQSPAISSGRSMHSMHESLVQPPAISSGRSMHSMHESLVHSVHSPTISPGRSMHSMHDSVVQSSVVSAGHSIHESLVHSSTASSDRSMHSRHDSLGHSIHSTVISSDHSMNDSLVHSQVVSSGRSIHDSLVHSPVVSSGRLMHSTHDSLVYSNRSPAISPGHSIHSHHISPAYSTDHSVQSQHVSSGRTHVSVQSQQSLSARSHQSHVSSPHTVHSQYQGLSLLQSPQRVSAHQSLQGSPAYQSPQPSITSQPHIHSSHQILSPHSVSSQQDLSVHSVNRSHSASSGLSHQGVSLHTSLYAPEYLNRPQSAFSAQSVQSTKASSVHSLVYVPPSPERSRSDVSLHKDQSTHTSVLFPLSSGKSQSVHTTQASSMHTSAYFPMTPESSQPVSQTPSMHSTIYSDIIEHTTQLGYSPRSVPSCQSIQTPYSVHSFHSIQSHETVDSSARDVSDINRPHNLNEEFTRTTHPGSLIDNNDNDFDNNFNPDDNKPRFFVQDKPAPGQNIFAPTPKRPNTGDRSTRIPFLSPTMRRAPEFVTPTTTFSQVVTSPRSYRRDTTVRVQSDTSIISGGAVQKTKIPGPHTHSKPVSPDRTKKWVFGKHKNATVMNVLITKSPDLGFSITDVAGKGIFIDDVKGQDSLSVGDKILEVEGIDVTVLNKEEVMEILLSSGKNISMMISHI